VIDWLRRPTKKQPILHRATCTKIRGGKSKKTHWTTGRHLKACSLELDELISWVVREVGHEPLCCEDCTPQNHSSSDRDTSFGKTTKLGREILDYITEVAVINLDNVDLRYDLTVNDVANYLSKTTGQIAVTLLRLIQDGYLQSDSEISLKADLSGNRRVFPTSQALRMLPAFEKLSTKQIEDELKLLARGTE